MNQLVIKNSVIINEGKALEKDLLIKDGRIERIESSIDVEGDYIDATGLYVLPGFIDDQVHFREPGLTEKGDIKSESGAAVAGGTTSFMDMPNVNPPTLTSDLWQDKNNIAARNSLSNYSFYMGTSNHNIDEIKKINPSEVCGVKIFMGSSTGNLIVDDEKSLESIFKHSPVLITTHCEDTPSITENEKKFFKEYGEDIPIHFHEHIRSRSACLKSTKKAINLAEQFNSDLHVLHISTKDEVVLFELAPIESKKITCEVCIPHLFFSSEDYENKGALIKCNPSIKSKADKEALRRALAEGRIDYVATDHAPHTIEDKETTFDLASFGMIGLESCFGAINKVLVHDEGFELGNVLKLLTSNPRAIMGFEQDLFSEGTNAEITILDPDVEWTFEKVHVQSRSINSPYYGEILKGKVEYTISRGQIIIQLS